MWVYWLIMLLQFSPKEAAAEVKHNCESSCGNISIPYPFGIGHVSCALNNNFFLNCSSDELMFGEYMWFKDMSLNNGTVTVSVYAAFDCYNNDGQLTSNLSQRIDLGSGPFTFSATENKFVATGCDTLAMVVNLESTYMVACASLCDVAVNFTEMSKCTGSGCCMTSIGKNLKSAYIEMGSFNNYTNVSEYNSCGYGFLVAENSFRVSDWDFSNFEPKKSDVVIEWVVESKTCEDAKANQSSYSCGNNTECQYSDNGKGYRCSCLDGFEGNPYLPFGCEGTRSKGVWFYVLLLSFLCFYYINECSDTTKYPCKGKCKNTYGNYTCQCPLGMRGNGKSSCEGFRITTIAAVVGGSIFLVIFALLLCIMWTRRQREKIFRQNGGLILKLQRITLFTEAELSKATKNFDKDWFLGEGGFGSVYKGVLPDNTIVAVKKPKELERAQLIQEFQHEMGIVSQVNHRNVVKILGLCLETKIPLLVYEFISNGTLFQHIHNKRSQILKQWRNRLRIAAETASALVYLHSLADPPIIHGDVKSMNILLDDNYTAKVSDFGASVLVSPSQHDIIATKIQGTLGYLDPEYLVTGILTEKSDVYSFGVVLIELLTGEKPNSSIRNGEKKNIIQHFISSLENSRLEDIICFSLIKDEMEEIREFSELAKRCINPSGAKRPSTKEVSKELGNLMKKHKRLWSHQNSEETDHLLAGEVSGKNRPDTPDTICAATFSIEYSNDSI